MVLCEVALPLCARWVKYWYIVKLWTTLGIFFRSYSDFLTKFGAIPFQKYVTMGISHSVFCGDLLYILRGSNNFISPGTKIVKRLRRRRARDHRKGNKIKSLVLGPSTATCELILKFCSLINKTAENRGCMMGLSQPPQRRQGPELFPLWLLFGTPTVLGLSLLQDRRSTAYSCGCHWLINFKTSPPALGPCLCI